MEHQLGENDPLLSHPKTVLAKYKESIRILFKSPRDFWLMLVVKMLSFGGFSVLIVALSLFLTEVLEYTDIEMGLIIAVQGICSGFYTLYLGNFPDRYGIRFSLMFGNICKFLCFLVLITIENRYVIILSIWFLLTPGAVITIPTTKLAVKRYTYSEAQSIGFSLYFVTLFGASAIAAVATDVLISSYGLNMTTFRYTFIFGIVAIVIAIILTYYMRELDVRVTGEVEIEIGPRETSIMQDTRSIMILKKFWRFTLLTLLLVFVRAVYIHINITMPLFMDRDIERGAHFGYMIALHEVCTLIFTPTLTAMIYCFSHYNLLVIGGLITSVAPLVFLLPTSYSTVSVFVIVTAIGEAIQAPRLLDYSMSIAPDKREGIFLAISAIPLTLSFIIAGLMAGVLLENFCPSDGQRDCWKMWGIISLSSTSAVLIIFFCRRWLEQPSIEGNPYMICSKESKLLSSHSNSNGENTLIEHNQ